MTGVQANNSRNFILSVLSNVKTVLSKKLMFFIVVTLGVAAMSIAMDAIKSMTESRMNIILLILFIIFIIVFFSFVFLSFGAFIYASFLTLLDQKVNIGEAFSHALSYIWSFLGLGLMTGLAFFIIIAIPALVTAVLFNFAMDENLLYLFAIVLAIPMLILYLMWYVTFPVCILDNERIMDTFGRSRQLTEGYRLHIFGILVIFGLIDLLGSAIGLFPVLLTDLGLLYLSTSTIVSIGIIFNFIGEILSYLSFFLTPIVITCVYYELRLRKEPEALNNLIKNNYYVTTDKL
ncbi:hypothetical protein [Desulfovibrio litoralis]|uniref:Glycerophosphoryl diester phosphodiesterase membrane domain-containing protein n=1 Tax=Desulfovibrio litoralis DSM 11393 TaxID=1121455 RepID=A0A1M7SGC9_9BACT|nr:hypothetical protein [Desulfovibrio litoralis]SHN57556.1 hypothetical protein SAMN02745728_00919 [Desulfovibrio litoralis DSM 11393]